MDIDLLNNKIVIIKDGMKNSLLRLISESKKLLNIKIITLSELKKSYYFDYDKESIYHVCNKYNCLSDIAKKYIDNLYFIGDIDEDKINYLKGIKKELDNNGLLKYDKLFNKYLCNKDIVLFDLKYVDSFYTNIFNKLKENNNVIEYNYEKDYGKHDLYEASSIEEEVSFVASKICKLIKSGVDINKIKIANLNDEYYFIVKKIFSFYNIPINLKSNSSIKGTKIVKFFKSHFSSDIESTLSCIKELVYDKNDEYIYNKIVDVINSYSFIDIESAREYIFDDIDKINTYIVELNNAVRVIDIYDDIVSEDAYVFLINYNEGIIPVNHKDEGYLSDNNRSKLSISTSFDLNEKDSKYLVICIKRIKNLIVTYTKGKETYISSSYSEVLFNKCDLKIDYNDSNLFNRNKLTSMLDNYNKYGVICNELSILKNYYSDFDYLDYSNKYSLIDKTSLFDFIGNKLSLSYSTLSNYFSCSFKYYLENVLRLNKYEDSFEMTIGNIFHHILAVAFKEGFNFEYSWNNEIDNSSYTFNNSEKFFIGILKDKLEKVIEIIKSQLKYTQLDKTVYEKEIIVKIDDECNVTFKGFVDKILYGEFDSGIIAIIIDYKTGNPKLNIKNSKYGLDMQLPAYVYLIKNEIKDVKIGGFYLQKILNVSKDEEEEKNNLKLQGYSNSNPDILEKVDSTYNDSELIRGMKTTASGFYHYSKVISDDELDELYNLVESKIKEASHDILEAKFDINPKIMKDENISCKYCRYKDICYMKNEDTIELEDTGGEE